MKNLIFILCAAIAFACNKSVQQNPSTSSTKAGNDTSNYFDYNDCSGATKRAYMSSTPGLLSFGQYPGAGSSFTITYSLDAAPIQLLFNTRLETTGVDTLNGGNTVATAKMNLPLSFYCHPNLYGLTYTVYASTTGDLVHAIKGNILTITKYGNVGQLVQGTFKLKLAGALNYPQDTLRATGRFSIIRNQ